MASPVARLIEDELESGAHAQRPSFKYWDRGGMSTIGRSAAVAQAGPMELTGFPAWLAWTGIHLLFLVGFRNKAAALLRWVYSHFTCKRGARIIMGFPERHRDTGTRAAVTSSSAAASTNRPTLE
ncbi:MAG: hypothetical protein FJ386_07670 [Verrucomicrobia bacterium]|nr:hypothetical protein [Verrucomicrobiota bacterium]